MGSGCWGQATQWDTELQSFTRCQQPHLPALWLFCKLWVRASLEEAAGGENMVRKDRGEQQGSQQQLLLLK